MKDFEEARPAKRDWKRECKELEALVAQQAAVIEQMRESLEDAHAANPCDTGAQQKAYTQAIKVLALQPCPEVLNKVRADAVRKNAEQYRDWHNNIYQSLMRDAQRIEQGEA